MDMMLGQNTAHYRYIYLYICIFYSLQFSFLLWRMKNSHLVVINKVEIKTTVNTHFLQEVSTDISSYPELVFFFFFFHFTFSHERAVLLVGWLWHWFKKIDVLFKNNSVHYSFISFLKVRFFFFSWKLKNTDRRKTGMSNLHIAREPDFATWLPFYIWNLFWEFNSFEQLHFLFFLSHQVTLPSVVPFFFLKSTFKSFAKLREGYRNFPYILCPYIGMVSPIIATTQQNVFLLQLMNLHWHIIITQGP